MKISKYRTLPNMVIEFVGNSGKGGMIEFIEDSNGVVHVEIYRLEGEAEVGIHSLGSGFPMPGADAVPLDSFKRD
jgi:hypothetical protein